MDQDGTWRGCRPQPRPYCVRWGPSFPSPKGAHTPIFPHVCCGQMAEWIKMPLGTEVGLGPDHIMLDGDPAPPPPKGAQHSPHFSAMSVVTKHLEVSRCHLARRQTSAQITLCYMGTLLPPQKGAQQPPLSQFMDLCPYKPRSISVVAKRLDGSG